MIKKILIGILVLLLLLIVIIAMRPDGYRTTRSTTIAAPPAVVFDEVNTLQNWDAWSPWAKIDPNAKKTYEGPASGVGAKYNWSGNSEVGEGNMTIAESRTNEYVKFDVVFIKPFSGNSTAEFTFKPDDAQTNQTVVSWSMSGKNNFVGKAMGLFMDSDKMLGGYFEKGLAQMKTVAEASAKK